MYYISVEESFDAAHFLREYGGKCERLHGHRFKVVVKLRSAKLNKTGMAYDFTELKKQVNEILDIAGFASILPIFKTIDEAVNACAT